MSWGSRRGVPGAIGCEAGSVGVEGSGARGAVRAEYVQGHSCRGSSNIYYVLEEGGRVRVRVRQSEKVRRGDRKETKYTHPLVQGRARQLHQKQRQQQQQQ